MEKSQIRASVKENKQIERKMKEVTIDIFSDIYNFLGERGFKQWVLDNQFRPLSRRIIVKSVWSFSDEKGNLRNIAVGEQDTDKKTGRSRVRVLKSLRKDKRVVGHEIFHAVSRGKIFNDFFVEGITEFFTIKLFGESKCAYDKNVSIASLLYAMYPDQLIKYYITSGIGFEKYLQMTAGKDNPTMRYYLDEINKHFSEVNKLLFSTGKADEYIANREMQYGIESLVSAYFEFKKGQIKDLHYIKDGKVDFESFINEIIGVNIEYNSTCKALHLDQKRSSKCFEKELKGTIKSLIKNSHLLIGLPENNKEEVEFKITTQIIGAINEGVSNGRLEYRKINQDEEPYRSLNLNAKEKLLQGFLEEDEEEPWHIDIERLNKIGNIARATNMAQEEIEDAIKKIDFYNLPEDSRMVLDIAQKYGRVLASFQSIEAKNEEEKRISNYYELNVKDTRGFIEVQSDTGEMNMYILNNDTGQLDKLSLNRVTDFSPEGRVSVRLCIGRDGLPNEVKGSDRIYRVILASDEQETFIGIDDATETDKLLSTEIKRFRITNGSIQATRENIQDVKESFFRRIVFNEMYSKIEDGEYMTSKESDEETDHKNADSIDYDRFVEDYLAITKTFKREKIPIAEAQSLSEMLIDKAFYGQDESEKSKLKQNVTDLVSAKLTERRYSGFLAKSIEATKARIRTGEIMNQIESMESILRGQETGLNKDNSR